MNSLDILNDYSGGARVYAFVCIPYHTIPTRVLYLLVSLCDCVSGIECVRTSEAWNIDRESSVHRSSARHTVCECSHEQKQSRRATVTSQKQQRKIFH